MQIGAISRKTSNCFGNGAVLRYRKNAKSERLELNIFTGKNCKYVRRTETPQETKVIEKPLNLQCAVKQNL